MLSEGLGGCKKKKKNPDTNDATDRSLMDLLWLSENEYKKPKFKRLEPMLSS